MKVNILLCDTFPGLLPPEIPSYVSMFERLFRSVSKDVVFQVFPAMEGVLPELQKTGGIYLITGCNRSVYEDISWVKELLEWIRQAVFQTLPLVGVCFGHQALALALGGKVERFVGGWGVGVRESEIQDGTMRPFFPDGRIRLLYNHHDQVLELPEDAVCLATSDFCRYEGFRIGRHILTFQGHPEYTPEYERHLLLHHSTEEDAAVKQKALDSITKLHHQGEAVAKYVCSFFGGR